MSKTVSEAQLKSYYEVAVDLVKKCGPLMLEGYQKGQTDFKVKADFYDLVTVYDKQIEDKLTKGLLSAFPESLIIGEEESAATKRLPELTDAPTWIIDPIDGTTNFIRRIPHCCISVGLAINKELVVGVVYNPPADELFTAWKGHGAFLNGQPINVSKVSKINQAVIAYEISLIHAPSVRDKNIKRIYKLASNATGTRCFGSAALTLCYVATGQVDVYHIEDLKPWDLAGGAVILREAGGVVCHTNGGEFDIMKPNCVCTSTKELSKEVISLIDEANQIMEYTFK
ncbi:inositol monophosphatase 2-like [Scaptodrosophila lebanonensis]|uniref:Inositol-1-monophosphatase n=1 Tax=Drosophila lebanonensis TaxID=7225 RepID=A0A6J2UIL7_DROLE|nr:inositol monophosphatase 2-like [Scaptodrosophila lebanonensis]